MSTPINTKRDNIDDQNKIWVDTKPKEVIDFGGQPLLLLMQKALDEMESDENIQSAETIKSLKDENIQSAETIKTLKEEIMRLRNPKVPKRDDDLQPTTNKPTKKGEPPHEKPN
jgi:hypothetical protein